MTQPTHSLSLSLSQVEQLTKQVKDLYTINDRLSNTNEKLNNKLAGLVSQIKSLRTQLSTEKKGVAQLSSFEAQLAKLKKQVGLSVDESFPKPFRGKTSGSRKHSDAKSMRMLAAVVKGRGSNLVVRAVQKSNGRLGLENLANSRQMQPIIKQCVKESIAVIQTRLDAKHGLFCLLFLNLSRAEYITLRNTISYTYNAAIDSFEKLIVWTNKFDENDVLEGPAMASVWGVNKERDRQYDGCHVLESDDGESCQRDCELVWQALYTQYSAALRDDFSEARPAKLNIYCDATGAWRGSSITHAEAGSGDWLEGGSISKLTLFPIAACEGTDSTANMALMLAKLAAPSIAKLLKQKTLSFIPAGAAPLRTIAAAVFFCADMQGHKAHLAFSKSTHVVWCFCKLIKESASLF